MSKDVGRAVWISFAAIGLISILATTTLGVWKLIEILHDQLSQSQIISKSAVLQTVQHVNKQTFVQHDIAVDISYLDAPQGWLSWLAELGVKQEFVVLVWGRVPAGFNLQELGEDDIWLSSDGKQVQLTLPPPMVFLDNVSIDTEKTQVFTKGDLCPDFVCENPLEAYQTKVMPEAVDRIVATALEYGILDQAARDGKIYYEQLLRSLGFEEVTVIVTGYSF